MDLEKHYKYDRVILLVMILSSVIIFIITDYLKIQDFYKMVILNFAGSTLTLLACIFIINKKMELNNYEK